MPLRSLLIKRTLLSNFIFNPNCKKKRDERSFECNHSVDCLGLALQRVPEHCGSESEVLLEVTTGEGEIKSSSTERSERENPAKIDPSSGIKLKQVSKFTGDEMHIAFKVCCLFGNFYDF